MALPKWQRNGGRDFAFYHSHSGFEWGDMETTNKYQDMMCQDFQVGSHTAVPHGVNTCLSSSPRRKLCSSCDILGLGYSR